MEAGAGLRAGFVDSEYAEKGVRIVPARGEVFAAAVCELAGPPP